MNRLTNLFWSLVFATTLVGCIAPQVKPGHIETPIAKQTQSQSPKDASKLITDSTKTIEFTIPAGSTISQPDPVTGMTLTVTVASNTPVRLHSQDKVDSVIGAADMSIGKLVAKLQSVKWIQGVGIVVFLFGLASFAWPPLRVIVGSVTTSTTIAVAGIALIVLPIVVIGHELIILISCLGAAGAYFFIHRYGKKSGEVEIMRKWIDKNNDGKVDPGEIVEVEK